MPIRRVTAGQPVRLASRSVLSAPTAIRTMQMLSCGCTVHSLKPASRPCNLNLNLLQLLIPMS